MRTSTVAFPGMKSYPPRQGPEEQLAASVHERQTVRDEVRENVSIEHHDHADDGRKRHGMPEDVAEDHAFVADLIGSGGRLAKRFRVPHPAQPTPRAVRGTHHSGAMVQLPPGDALATSGQRVR